MCGWLAVPDVRIDGRAAGTNLGRLSVRAGTGRADSCVGVDLGRSDARIENSESALKSSQKAAIASMLEVLDCLVDWRCSDTGELSER